MATWPTPANLQQRYGDLLNVATTRLAPFVADAKARVLKVMSEKYDVTLWTGSELYSAATISALGADNSFNDTAFGLPSLDVGDDITAAGFADVWGNNGLRSAVSSTPSKVVLSGGDLVQNESASPYNAIAEAESGLNRYRSPTNNFPSWLAGQKLLVSGFPISSNNGVKTVVSMTGTTYVNVVETTEDDFANPASLAAPYVTLTTGAGVPPQAAAWVARLAHAYFQQDVHFGASPESGSNPATTVRDQVEQEMKDTLEPGAQLLDDDGNPIPINPGPSFPSAGARSVLLRTIRPIFDMRDRERQRAISPDPPTGTPSGSRWR